MPLLGPALSFCSSSYFFLPQVCPVGSSQMGLTLPGPVQGTPPALMPVPDMVLGTAWVGEDPHCNSSVRGVANSAEVEGVQGAD